MCTLTIERQSHQWIFRITLILGRPMSRYVLGRIVVSEGESDSHHQTHDYKGFNPSTDWDTVDWLKSNAIQVQSVS